LQNPCKIHHDRTFLTNILLVILSGHVQRNLTTVFLCNPSQNLAITTTGLQSVDGTQVANDLWTFKIHTASLLINREFTYIRSSTHSQLLQLIREHLLLQYYLLFSIQFMSYSVFLQSVFLLHISHIYNKLFYVEFNWSGVTLTRQTEAPGFYCFVVRQLNLTTTALCALRRLLCPDNFSTRTFLASRFVKRSRNPSPSLPSPVISVHHIAGSPRVHIAT
jgi:hypothetical protein